MGGGGDGGNGADRAGDIWRAWGCIAEAAAIQARRQHHDPDATDFPRPAGRVTPQLRTYELTAEQLEHLARLYDPDLVHRQFYKPAEEVNRWAYVPVVADPPAPHRLQVITGFRPHGGRLAPVLREVRCATARELRDLADTVEYKRSRFYESTGHWQRRFDPADYEKWVRTPLREAYWDTLLSRDERAAEDRAKLRDERRATLREVAIDPFAFGDIGDGASGLGGASVTRDMDQEFVPIMGGVYHVQLYLYAHWEMTAKAFEMKNHSELAKAAIGINTDFTLGRGIAWKIHNRRVGEVWEEFWKRNKMEARIRQLSDDMTWQGELIIRWDQPLVGYLRIRSVNPSVIYEIVTEPSDIEQVYFAHLSFPTQYQQPYTEFHGIHMQVPLMRYIIDQIPATEFLHVKQNVSAYEKWGRSDFFASLGTLKRHRDWTNATTLRDMLQANLVWEMILTGDDSDVQAFISDPSNAQLPPFGGTFVHNTALEFKSVHQDTASGSSRGGPQTTGGFLTALFATGQNMPLSYFNVGIGVGGARATALVQGEPFVKKVASRQQTLRRMLDDIYVEVMRVAVAAGRLDASQVRGVDADPEWIFPSTYEEDRGAKFRDLAMAYQLRTLSHARLGSIMAQELQQADYDYDEEMHDIRNEQGDPLLAPPPTAAASGAPSAAPASNSPSAPPAGLAAPSANQREPLAGADERADFRRTQRQRPAAQLGSTESR